MTQFSQINSNNGDNLAVASLLRRLMSLIYDMIIALPLMLLVSALTTTINGGSAGSPDSFNSKLTLVLALGVVALYFFLSWKKGGQTLGMRAWRLKVSALDGQPLSARQARRRLAAGCISLLCMGIPWLFMYLHPQRQAWMDRATHTMLALQSKH